MVSCSITHNEPGYTCVSHISVVTPSTGMERGRLHEVWCRNLKRTPKCRLTFANPACPAAQDQTLLLLFVGAADLTTVYYGAQAVLPITCHQDRNLERRRLHMHRSRKLAADLHKEWQGSLWYCGCLAATLVQCALPGVTSDSYLQISTGNRSERLLGRNA
jgi:hypothetical protein